MKKIILSLLVILLLFEVYSLFFANVPQIKYVDRHTNEIKTEKVMAQKGLRWLYYDPLGKLTLNALIKRKFISDWYGKKMDLPSSKKKIKPFVKKLNLKNTGNLDNYNSFNDFFTRPIPNLGNMIDFDSLSIVSPACGKVLAFENLSDKENFYLKGLRFTLREFLNNKKVNIDTASVFIIRLTPADYHRFYFPLDCQVLYSYDVGKDLYSVSPIALKTGIKVFLENKRTITVCRNKFCNEFVISEVGATFIGSIIQTYSKKTVKKGDPKGYFKFGGSSVVLIFNKNRIKMDADILLNTKKGYETTIFAGEKIGKMLK